MRRNGKSGQLALAIAFFHLVGCGPNAREVLEKSFSQDAPVIVEYQPDGSTLHKTRNIVIFAEYAKSILSSLVMLVAVSGDPIRDSSSGKIEGLMKFRSVDHAAHFDVHRNLILTLANQRHDLGPCAYQQNVRNAETTIEDLTVVVPEQIVRAMAGVDNVTGLIGEVEFALTTEQLLPIRALVDTLGTRK